MEKKAFVLLLLERKKNLLVIFIIFLLPCPSLLCECNKKQSRSFSFSQSTVCQNNKTKTAGFQQVGKMK
jgi:hypothetical protein